MTSTDPVLFKTELDLLSDPLLFCDLFYFNFPEFSKVSYIEEGIIDFRLMKNFAVVRYEMLVLRMKISAV